LSGHQGPDQTGDVVRIVITEKDVENKLGADKYKEYVAGRNKAVARFAVLREEVRKIEAKERARSAARIA
jgi:hypothetical protein